MKKVEGLRVIYSNYIQYSAVRKSYMNKTKVQ